MNGLLNGSWDKEITLLLHERKRVLGLNLLSTWVASEGSMLSEPLLGIIGVDTSGVVDGRVVLDDGGDLSTVTVEELTSPESNVTETLNVEGSILESLGKTNLFIEALVVIH